MLVKDAQQVLLMHKKRGLGAGKITAPGGKIDAGETPEAAAVRETQEEVGLQVHSCSPCALLDFQFVKQAESSYVKGMAMRVHVFLASGWHGEIRESPEALPFWVPFDQIPYGQMWADDRLWLPRILDGETLHGRFHFAGDAMLTSDISPREF